MGDIAKYTAYLQRSEVTPMKLIRTASNDGKNCTFKSASRTYRASGNFCRATLKLDKKYALTLQSYNARIAKHLLALKRENMKPSDGMVCGFNLTGTAGPSGNPTTTKISVYGRNVEGCNHFRKARELASERDVLLAMAYSVKIRDLKAEVKPPASASADFDTEDADQIWGPVVAQIQRNEAIQRRKARIQKLTGGLPIVLFLTKLSQFEKLETVSNKSGVCVIKTKAPSNKEYTVRGAICATIESIDKKISAEYVRYSALIKKEGLAFLKSNKRTGGIGSLPRYCKISMRPLKVADYKSNNRADCVHLDRVIKHMRQRDLALVKLYLQKVILLGATLSLTSMDRRASFSTAKMIGFISKMNQSLGIK